jgi:hypothetical protein
MRPDRKRLFSLICSLALLGAFLAEPVPAAWGDGNRSTVGGASYQWRQIHGDASRSYLYLNGVQIGGYHHASGYYRSYDARTAEWGDPQCPPWKQEACSPGNCPCGCEDGNCCCEKCNCRASNCPADPPKTAVVDSGKAMDLPQDQREWYRNPDGSCVQCSLGMCGMDQDVPQAATLLWDTEYGPRVRGGSNFERVANYCDRRGIQAYNVAGSTTWEWMRWAALTGRGAAIGAGGSHFQTLYGYDPAHRKWYVCNNNSPQKIDEYTDEQFRRLHLASGQWCVILRYPPHPTRPEYVEWWNDRNMLASASDMGAATDTEDEEIGYCWQFASEDQARRFQLGWPESSSRVPRGGHGAAPPDEVDRDAVMRLGDVVQPVGGGPRADEVDEWVATVGGPVPDDDSDKWFISIITMQGCAPCTRLKADWAKDPNLRAFAKPNDAENSWAHFHIYDKADTSQEFRFQKVQIASFPTILIQPPRSGKYGDPKTVVFQANEYSGNPKKLAEAMASALRRYVATLPKRDGGASQKDSKPPWKPAPKPTPAPPAPPDVMPGPNVPNIPPDVPPAVQQQAPAWIGPGLVLLAGGAFIYLLAKGNHQQPKA